MADFKLVSDFLPQGDQPRAIEELVAGLSKGDTYQTLLGVTGSGKTFSMANVIKEVQRPTLIMSHNKTLAAQLYGEFKQLFPENAVEYFISYYDYYQPEAYLPVTDTFIEKDSSVNEEIDKLRLKATSSLLSRKDVIVVSSVSCIYGIGSPEEYLNGTVRISKGDNLDRRTFLSKMVHIHYSRNDQVLERGNVRIRGDLMEVYPAYEDNCLRIELFGNEVESINKFDPISGEIYGELDSVVIFPAKHFVTDKDTTLEIIKEIRDELASRLELLRKNNKLLEAQRLEQRTNFDIEMMVELGYCSGIENYSRFFAGRSAGEKPYTLIDFFPKGFLTILDESHVTLPQIQGMYNGDRARKSTLVEHGFRLPSALDNRPLKYDEFHEAQNQVIFTSATPSERELELCGGVVVEQVIRPTGLLDPEVDIRSSKGQIDDLIGEIRLRSKRSERVLVTTLTKRMAEDLTEYLTSLNIRVKYLHSGIATLERVQILRELRLGLFDVLVGINLLREGLDLPEVSLVAVLDADKEGFLRSKSSLLQVAGRAARNETGLVILYGDRKTEAMLHLIDTSKERRLVQGQFNKKNNITPKTIFKSVDKILDSTSVANSIEDKDEAFVPISNKDQITKEDKEMILEELRKAMLVAAEQLEFEKAARIRDEINDFETDLGLRSA
ncbi:MAG: excinuclease ABC subunit UvrB [Candidatus Neomarinimicrobiota bacterium]|tara:strand:+ start:6706 stop:8709 length:2004 start_codon:yes stop_codon:yes gene_type:complete